VNDLISVPGYTTCLFVTTALPELKVERLEVGWFTFGKMSADCTDVPDMISASKIYCERYIGALELWSKSLA
jgi:hypothetical protein